MINMVCHLLFLTFRDSSGVNPTESGIFKAKFLQRFVSKALELKVVSFYRGKTMMEGKECGPHKGRGRGLNPGLRVLRSKGVLPGICLSAAEH